MATLQRWRLRMPEQSQTLFAFLGYGRRTYRRGPYDNLLTSPNSTQRADQFEVALRRNQRQLANRRRTAWLGHSEHEPHLSIGKGFNVTLEKIRDQAHKSFHDTVLRACLEQGGTTYHIYCRNDTGSEWHTHCDDVHTMADAVHELENRAFHWGYTHVQLIDRNGEQIGSFALGRNSTPVSASGEPAAQQAAICGSAAQIGETNRRSNRE
jgi:hypothetical protein